LQKTWTPFSNGLTFRDFFVIPAQAGIQKFLKRLPPDTKPCREVTKKDDFYGFIKSFFI
jgi:hypothetical protein